MADFVVMAKPAGSLCNMRCSYCYYLHADNGSAPMHMDDEVLEKYIRSYIEAEDGDVISITWHGGEPTLAGLDFYRKAVALEKKYLPAGKQCWNNLQTNGLALNEEWCVFLRDNHFDVGVSIDGTKFVHDLYRHDAAGSGTYDRVKNNILLLKKYGIRPDLLCTVTSDTADSARAVYQALRSFDTGWIQFIPIVRRGADGVTADSVTPEAYGRFLKTVFKEWASHDMGRVNVQLFSETSLVLAGGRPTVCWLAETCGNVLIVERDGGVYSCDHFVDRNHLLGNIMTDDLNSLVTCERQVSFGQSKKTSLCRECRECPYLRMCGGGCQKDRFGISEDGEAGRYYLCEGLKQFWSYAVPILEKAMAMSKEGIKPSAIMKKLF